MQRLTLEQFVTKATAQHGDKYDYTLAVYKNAITPIKIVCHVHGTFEKVAGEHLRGFGCPDCSIKKPLDIDTFIKRSMMTHGDRYDYSQTVYKSMNHKVIIRCPVHGDFSQKPQCHVRGNGCPKCSVSDRKRDTAQFVLDAQKVHGDLYDYSQAKYDDIFQKVKISCPTHGFFTQRPSAHLMGQGCPVCAKAKITHTAEQFIKNATSVHGSLYDYTNVIYKNNHTKVEIICPIHGSFQQTPSGHSQGKGCPQCTGNRGYDPEKPGTLYYVRFDLPEMVLFKIGITNKTIRERFHGFRVKPTIIWQRQWDDGRIAAREERRILRGGLYDDCRYTGEPLLESGNTECFTIDIMQLGNTTRVVRSIA